MEAHLRLWNKISKIWLHATKFSWATYQIKSKKKKKEYSLELLRSIIQYESPDVI